MAHLLAEVTLADWVGIVLGLLALVLSVWRLKLTRHLAASAKTALRRTHTLYVYGVVKYHDVFDDEHETEWFQRYDPGTGSMLFCEKRNDMT